MSYQVRCSACGQATRNLLAYKCSACGKPLEIQLTQPFQPEKIRPYNYTVWRYTSFFPYVEEPRIISLGEGWTPLMKLRDNVYLKLESLNPTGSFKDRGSTTLISAIYEQVKEADGWICEDSSGNAGASIAAYAARANLKARIYVPESVAGPKFGQIQYYGAEVAKVAGARNKVAEEAQKPERKKYYVGHILHPLFRDGIRSLAYEMAEQFGWRAPEHVYLPASAGTLLLGVVSGFKHLFESNVIENTPRVVACQTSQVSPLYHRLKGLTYCPPEKSISIADALASVNPPLLDLMAKALKEAKGDAVMVEEAEIAKAFKELAGKGFFVEPSSAVAYAAYKKQTNNGKVPEVGNTVIVLTGFGLKTALKPTQVTSLTGQYRRF